ncbi:protein SPIRAL1-like 2 [Primulina eburnea]|uniref:protein SPIRAL1-like 2 n=1 Tax=Primulina eburnea TaxID=1245227 RepID=UPI003C6BFF33
MGRGVSSGGGQSSLGYLFGDGGAPAPKSSTSTAEAPPQNPSTVVSHVQEKVLAVAPPPAPAAAAAATKQIPAGVPGNQTNNYLRADGQNSGNFLTDRPSTKVHAAPGGGSSLGYLFGGGSN